MLGSISVRILCLLRTFVISARCVGKEFQQWKNTSILAEEEPHKEKSCAEI